MASLQHLQTNPIPPTKAQWLTTCALSAMMLQACSQSLPDRLGAPIEGYSHTSAAINYFMVNGNGGPNIGPYGGGGSRTAA